MTDYVADIIWINRHPNEDVRNLSEADRKIGSFSDFRLYDQPSTVAGQDMLDDGKPETGPLLGPAVLNVNAIEALGQARHMFCGYARPLVRDDHFDGLAGTAE
jgi:hypothetical protein